MVTKVHSWRKPPIGNGIAGLRKGSAGRTALRFSERYRGWARVDGVSSGGYFPSAATARKQDAHNSVDQRGFALAVAPLLFLADFRVPRQGLLDDVVAIRRAVFV